MLLPSISAQGKVLGILKPVGGGDPIPLMKPEVIVGRRRSCDIFLDFNNISGKHCQLRLINSVWHVRDLGSTNGTSLNGMALSSEHSVMPDDELSIASHLFTIDYEPGGPDALLQMQGIEEHGEEGQGRRHSILELAGIETDDDRPRHRKNPSAATALNPIPGAGPAPAPVQPKRPAAPPSEFGDDIPDDFQAKPASAGQDDDDFLKFIEEDVKRAGDKREGKK